MIVNAINDAAYSPTNHSHRRGFLDDSFSVPPVTSQWYPASLRTLPRNTR